MKEREIKGVEGTTQSEEISIGARKGGHPIK